MADEPIVADALDAWRDAERSAVRSTAQREAADIAVEAAQLAQIAARATSDAADAATAASAEAARAASTSADAADTVVAATRMDADASRIVERDALAREREAHGIHKDAVERADRRYQDGG